MAPRKRTALKPNSLTSENGSPRPKNNSQSRNKNNDMINHSDITLYLRFTILILLVLAVGGFLLYPDILHLMKVFRENKENDVPISEKTRKTPLEELLTITPQDEDIQANAPSDYSIESDKSIIDDTDEGDLMEDEELHKPAEQKKSSNTGTQNVNVKENAGTKIKHQNGNSLPEKEVNSEKVNTLNKKSSSTEARNKKQGEVNMSQTEKNDKKAGPIEAKNKKQGEVNMSQTEKNDKKAGPIEAKNKKQGEVNMSQKEKNDKKAGPIEAKNKKQGEVNMSQKEKNDKKAGPIVLNAENNNVVLDSSQIKFVDSLSDERVSTKRDKDNISRDSSKTQNTEKNKTMSGSQAKMQKTSDEGNLDVIEEAKKFNSTFQKTFTPKKIFADGRRIPPIELLHQKKSNSSVRVFLFDDFLSQQECDGLIKAHDTHVKALNKPPILCFDSITTLRNHIKDVKKNIKVTPRDFTKGTKCVNASFSIQLQEWMKSNWSYSTAFYPGESTFSKIIAYRIKEAMGLDPASGGKFQITSYPEGKAYKEHTDCTLDGNDLRDRVVSVLMYLSNVEEGGETTFPDLGIWVKPRKGRAIVWNNMSPDGVCEEHSKHVASVVKKGSKYILIRWYYYKTFYSLGRRPQPPLLPDREPDQPMVNCDEYNSGSCRWYDEWTYECLLDYKKNKLQLI